MAAVAEQPEVVLGRCWCGCDEIYRSGKGCNIDSCVYVVFLLEGYCTILGIVFGPLYHSLSRLLPSPREYFVMRKGQKGTSALTLKSKRDNISLSQITVLRLGKPA